MSLTTAALIGNLVLVAITAWYAWQTRLTVLEMKESRRAAIQPVVALDLDNHGSVVLAKIENVGAGPALGASAELRLIGVDTTASATISWETPVLRPGESRLVFFPLKAERDPFSFQELRNAGAVLEVEGACKNALGEVVPIRHSLSINDSTRNEVTISSSEDVSSRLKEIRKAIESLSR